MPKNKKQTKIKISKKNSLKKGFFASLFKKSSKKKEIIAIKNTQAKSMAQYLAEYELKTKKSLGKKYRFRKKVLQIVDFLAKAIRITLKLSWWASVRMVAIVIMAGVIFSGNTNVLSAPQSVTVTTKSQWERGSLENISSVSSNDAIQLKSDGTWNARTWAPTPDSINFGSSSALVDGYLYVTRGYADKSFYRYNIGENKWDILADLPQATHYGCDMADDGAGNIYFIFGGFSKDFYKYNIENASWTQLPNLLDTVYTGAAIEFDGTDMFITRGQTSTDFWKFDISENTWYNTAPVTATLNTGSSMVYGNNGYMYVTRGSATNTLYRYSISGNSWSTLTNATTTFNGEQKGVFYNNYIYYLVSNTTTTFLRYSIAGNSWTTLETSPQTNNLSSLTFNSEDNLIYAIRGAGTYNMWKFDPNSGATGSWLGPQDLPAVVGTGGDFIWNKVEGAGAYVYALRGGANSFYRYDITANTWSTMTNAPASFSYDTKGTYHNGFIYIPLGNNTATFYIYNVAGNSWSTASTTGLGTLGYGSSAIYNSGDGYVYVTRTNGTNNFYRYDITGNSWTTMAPSLISGGADYRNNVGSRLVSDGTNLYMMPGDGETAFLRYNVGANNWTELASTSFAQFYGTDMSYFNGKIYAIAGYYKDETWEYTIATNTWRQLPANQKYVYERGPYNGASFEYMGNNSFLAAPGFGLVDVWSYTLGTNNYLTNGSYISEEIDLSYVSSWLSLNVNKTILANTNVVTETRTSADGESWSSWEALSGTDIQSSENRYIQVKFTLSSTDGINTPTINDFTIAYNSEDNDPNNPTTITGYSQRISGDILISGNSYKYSHPYFSWNEAVDNDSGVEGYWVYFGTDSGADPETQGSYTTSPEFLVNTAMQTGDYYLRIKTKDSDNNISDSAWNAFNYNYGGVSPYLTEEKTSEADFQSGTMDNVSAKSDGSFRLDSIAGFWNEKRLSYAPAGFRYGARLAYVESSNKIYVLRGDASTTFYSYDIATDVWSTLTVAPATVRYGSFLVPGPDGYLYASRGYDTADFWRYDISENIWETVSSAPKVFTYGGSLQYDGSRYIYGLPGNDDAFYRYDTQNNIWTALENAEFGNPNESDGQRVYEGSYTAYDNSDNIYTLQGNNYPYFSKYSIASGQWSTLEKAPVGIYNGGSLTYDDSTNAVYMLSGKQRQNFFKYDVESNVWNELPMIPSFVGYGGSLQSAGGYIYATRGEGSNAFYKFNLDENCWEAPQKGFFGPSDVGGGSSFGFYYGTNLTKDEGNNIYIARGNSDNTFGRYNYQTGEFTQLAKTPVGIYNGSAIAYNEDEGSIYLTPGAIRTVRSGSINNYFMKYTISSNSWEIITTDRIPLQTGAGSRMLYDGSRYIYLTRGVGTSNWWRYDTTALAGSRWSALLPTIANWNQGADSDILYKDGYIYSTRAQNTNTFWRYDVAAGSWLQRTNTPATIGVGSSLTDGNDGYLYLTRGINTNAYYRYNISENTWETIANFPGQVNIGGNGDYASNRIWSTVGNGTNSYPDGLYSYVVGSETNGTAFEKRGSYISESMDLLSVYRWANLDINYIKPAGTSVNIYTRTSANQTDWSTWDLVNNEKYFGSNHYNYDIVSPTNEYIQVRIDLFSGDQIFSPSITDYEINYYQDVLAPSNPTTVSAYSAVNKITTINSATWYGHSNPYFEWPADEIAGGASDGSGGSGVKGYWVYFGTNASADAFVDGTYQTVTNYTANGIAAGQNYYLLIKAVDDANMIPAVSYNAFNYRFDNISPNNPTDISVTPAGYTAIDNYSFLWENNISDAHSGVQKIQYRTGGDEADTWFDVPNITDVSIIIPNAVHAAGAYQSGKNWLYLRVVDNAGNVSTPISQEYYFSADAPTPPENLTVTPAYSTGNSFAFEWDQPLSFIGEASKLKYYYTINTLPNAYNVVETVSAFAGPGPFATQKGENRFYVVAKDEAGNIDYNLYSYIDFTADTSAPGAPINVQIFDTSDRENAEYSVATKWTPPAGANSDNFEGYVIYRSTELDGTYTSVATTSGTAYVDTGLESKPYYYYIKAKDNTNNLSIASSSVTIIPTGRYTTAPALIQKPTVKVQSFIATFNWGTSRVASSFVEYGKSISLGETNGQVDSATDHEVIVNGLSAATKYYYKVKYIDPDGNIGTSEVGNFTTLDPPVVSEFTVSDIKLDNALISWKTNTSATCTLKYGAGSLSNTIEETSGASSHIQKITGLTAETGYQSQVDCVDSDLNEFNSDQYTFSTPVKPIASDVRVQNIENVDLPTILVEYKTNVKATTRVTFKHANEDTPHNYLIEEKVLEHKAELNGLDPAKEYVLTILGIDENGIELEPVEQKITTKSDSRPPEVTVNRAVGKVLGRGASSQANLYVKIETNEPTKLKIKYTKGASVSGFDQSTGEDPLNTYHLVTIPAEVGQMYSYKAEIVDEAGNLTNSKVSTIIVEDAKSSASEIIIGTTTKQFGWLSELWNK